MVTSTSGPMGLGKVATMSTEQQRAVDIARARPDLSVAAIARAVGLSYGQAYRALQRAGVVAQRAEAYRERERERLAEPERQRERLRQLLAAYRDGALTAPTGDPRLDAVLALHTSLNVRDDVGDLRAWTRSGPLTGLERRTLNGLEGLACLRGPMAAR
jgi:AcrR family transcriptional regulator